MNSSKSFLFAMLFALCALSGCGVGFTGLPDVGPATQQTALVNLQGSNFGGHAPIAGAHVYVLQPGTNGYGSKVTSLLSSSYSNGNQTYQDTFGTSTTNPTYGLYYVPTNSTGNFSITGDYACTPGMPVFLYADGGSTQFPYNTNVFSTTQVVVSNVTGSGMAQTATMTFTTSTTELFYVGETVVLSGYTGTWVSLNGTSISVVANGLTTTTFQATGVSTNSAQIVAGTFAVAGVATAFPQANYSIDNMAVLGNCPSSGNFSTPGDGAISYVYMNEVSTAAAAYALAPFADTTVNNDALHIGIPSGDALALQGLENAALTANNLYDIQGANVSTTFAGEGHIARSATPNGGYGAVPQQLMDTIGNILAACVDSNNLYVRESQLGTLSPQCSTLFANATSTGATTGTQPVDIATAAINLVHHPSGTGNASFVSNLYSLPVGNVPFSPNLGSQPNDFTLGITYSGTGFGSPIDLAVDGSGNVWVTSGAGYLTELTPSAALGAGSPITMAGPSYVAIDPSGNAWTTSTSNNEIYENTSAGATVANTPYTGAGTVQSPVGIAFDGSGNAYAADSNGAAGLLIDGLLLLNGTGDVLKISGTGSAATYTQFPDTFINLGLLYDYIPGTSQVAVDSAGYAWMSGDNNGTIARINGSTGAAVFNDQVPISCFVICSYLTNANGIAIDSGGNGWVAFNSGTPTLVKFTSTGTATQYTGGGLSGPFGVAVDGLGNSWVANQTGNSVSEFASTGAALTGTNGYQGGPLSAPTNLAVDGSGNVWVVNSASNSVTQLVGVAAPVVTPLSAGVAAGALGTRP